MIAFLPMISQAEITGPMYPFQSQFMFCAVETQHEGVLCSEIKRIRFGFMAHGICQQFASNNDANYLMNFQNRSRKYLAAKQLDVCDKLPGKAKWSCFVIEDCGMSSSISPIGVDAFAPSGNAEQARDNCVVNGWAEYRQALINVNHGCKIAPDAAELAF